MLSSLHSWILLCLYLVRFFQLEMQMLRMVDLQVAASLPLVE